MVFLVLVIEFQVGAFSTKRKSIFSSTINQIFADPFFHDELANQQIN